MLLPTILPGGNQRSISINNPSKPPCLGEQGFGKNKVVAKFSARLVIAVPPTAMWSTIRTSSTMTTNAFKGESRMALPVERSFACTDSTYGVRHLGVAGPAENALEDAGSEVTVRMVDTLSSTTAMNCFFMPRTVCWIPPSKTFIRCCSFAGIISSSFKTVTITSSESPSLTIAQIRTINHK